MFSFDKTVKIINRETYTSGKKAASYCGRALAVMVSRSEIRMLESAELLLLRPVYREIDPVKGQFEWRVGDSGGSRLMKEYEGISGGYRVFQAHRGEKN